MVRTREIVPVATTGALVPVRTRAVELPFSPTVSKPQSGTPVQPICWIDMKPQSVADGQFEQDWGFCWQAASVYASATTHSVAKYWPVRSWAIPTLPQISRQEVVTSAFSNSCREANEPSVFLISSTQCPCTLIPSFLPPESAFSCVCPNASTALIDSAKINLLNRIPPPVPSSMALSPPPVTAQVCSIGRRTAPAAGRYPHKWAGYRLRFRRMLRDRVN